MENITVTYNGAISTINPKDFYNEWVDMYNRNRAEYDYHAMSIAIAEDLEKKLNFQVRYGFLRDLADKQIELFHNALFEKEQAEKVANRKTPELLWIDSLGQYESAKLLKKGYLVKYLDSKQFPQKVYVYGISDEKPDNFILDLSSCDEKVYEYTFDKPDDWDLGRIFRKEIRIFSKNGASW